jgi:hypothetical protein
MARLPALAAVMLAALLALGQVPAPAAAQAGESCAPDERRLTGAWTTTETVDGENESLWRGTLHLVQRGQQVVGRWEPPRGAPERLVIGSFVDGILRVTQRGMPAIPAAEVASAPARTWLLAISSDGKLLSGRWSEPAPGAPVRQGDLFASGEALCPPAPGEAPAAAATPAPAALLPAECPRWDLTGAWETRPAGDGPAVSGWRLWLWQDGDAVLGWYEPRDASDGQAPGGGPAPAWVVDGQLRGRSLRLVLHLGDSATLARLFTVSAAGDTLQVDWPFPFGPPETETLHGAAHCLHP